MYQIVVIGCRTGNSFRTTKSRTNLKIDRKARVHVVVDVLAFEIGVGAVGNIIWLIEQF